MGGKPCSRCKEQSATTWMKDGARCGPCFIRFMERVLKVALGGAPKANTATAVAVSGGFSSSAMLHLYQEVLHSKQRPPDEKPPRTIALHVIIPEELGGGGVKARDVAGQVAHNLNIEMIVCQIPEVAQENLVKMKNITDRTDLTRAVVYQTLISMAALHLCERILFGDSATRTAVDVLTKTITGHGTTIPSVVAKWITTDVMSSGVDGLSGGKTMTVARPLRDVQVRHCVSYIRLMYPGFVPAPPSEMSSGMTMGSLHGIVERFVADLTADNTGVVHNIVRTAEKLKGYELRGALNCGLCGGAVGRGDSRESARGETSENMAGTIENDRVDEGRTREERSGSVCQGCSCGGEVKPLLCYGCRETLDRSSTKDEGETVGNLVRWRIEGIARQAHRIRIRESIQKYLIEDE